ncbi:MAG: helix-hairpin-helix domain-containing protein [Bacteroidota bacterium]
MKHLLLSLLIIILILPLSHAQNRPNDEGSDEVDLAIEDFIIGQEVEEQVDYTFLTDFLEDARKRPLDLNSASEEELLLLPGFNKVLYNNLQQHIIQYGKLTSIYELQAVEGFKIDLIKAFRPYINVLASGVKDISPRAKFSRGPSVKEVSEGVNFEFIQRLVWIGEEKKGYTAADTTFRDILDAENTVIGQDTSLSSRYAGSPYRSYTRLRARYGKNFSFALTGEKDPGETFGWDPANQKYGYDFLSGHVSIGGYGPIERLVIGDYTLQFGQGMVLSRGLGFGKGAFVINSVKQPNTGILPYASVNENQLQRGAAVTLRYGNFHLTTFYSRIKLDASIQETDTLTNEILQAGSIQTSGLHRTASELTNRRAVEETMYGGRFEYKEGGLTLGTTHYQQSFGSELNKALNDYNQFDFRGDLNYVNGIDVDVVVQNFNFFGEAARSRSGGIGVSGGLMGSLSSTVDISILARHYDKDFHSLKGYVFAERPTALANETGVYVGLRIAPNPKWTWSSYFDQFYFPWNRFQASFPSQGWEFLSQLAYKPKRGTEVYVRFRSDNKERNASIELPNQKLEYLIPTRKNSIRLHFQSSINRNIQYRTRIEGAFYTQGDEEQHQGFLMYQDLIWKIGYKVKLTGRYALFDVSDYEARIYAYENDVLGFFSIPPYSGQGSRYYAIFNWKITRNLEFWARVAQSRFRNVCRLERDPFTTESTESEECRIGSGLEEIRDRKRTEFKLQLRYKF